MRRLIIAALLLQTIPAPASAALARIGVPRLSPAFSTPAVGMVRLTAPPLTVGQSAPALSLIRRYSRPPLARSRPRTAVAAAPAPAPAAAITLAAAAAVAAGEVAARPSDAAQDRAAVDFVDQPARREAAGEAVPLGIAAQSVSIPLPRGAVRSSPNDSPSIPAPARPAKPAPRLKAFLAGTFGAQLASNALQVTMPLLLLTVTGSAATAACAALASTIDAAGTLLGGRLVDRFGSRAVLVATTLARGAAVAALPLLAATGGLTMPAVFAVYRRESLARGVADTARNTVPLEFAGKDVPLLKKILAKNQGFFGAGASRGRSSWAP